MNSVVARKESKLGMLARTWQNVPIALSLVH